MLAEEVHLGRCDVLNSSGGVGGSFQQRGVESDFSPNSCSVTLAGGEGTVLSRLSVWNKECRLFERSGRRIQRPQRGSV